MKLVFWMFMVFFSCQVATGQDNQIVMNTAIFEMNAVDQQPEFPNGPDAFYYFFNKNFRLPEIPTLIGKIFLSFVVEIDGTLSDIKTIKDIGFGTGTEAENVLHKSPKWIPGKKDEKLVRVLYLLPIPIQTH